MKIKALIVASVLALSGCNEVNQEQINAAIGSVQKSAAAICGFVPLASSIVDIFHANGGGFSSTLDVARQICGAITVSHTSYRRTGVAPPPTLYGVPVRGRFVR